ncbi:hypothetical protein DY000_02015688 [Brassica cretica]|uniref:DUF295 domain-containing protein n=1 Tax=Brassica cretica TaxID=69181 RepID=A0ABQ7DA70_BRACR|nr:hypothetical protein DY000_02015688 [Brassica cretica]
MGPKLGPIGDVGTRRFSNRSGDLWLEPGGFVIVIGPSGRTSIQGFSFRSGDRIGTLVYLDPEAVSEPGGLDPEIAVWNPEEPGGSSLDPEIFDWNPEAISEPRGTVLCLPRKYYYRKSLTGLEGDGAGVMTQVPGLPCFPRLEK